MEWKSKWIKPSSELGDVCPLFSVTGIMKGQTINSSMIAEMIGGVKTIE